MPLSFSWIRHAALEIFCHRDKPGQFSVLVFCHINENVYWCLWNILRKLKSNKVFWLLIFVCKIFSHVEKVVTLQLEAKLKLTVWLSVKPTVRHILSLMEQKRLIFMFWGKHTWIFWARQPLQLHLCTYQPYQSSPVWDESLCVNDLYLSPLLPVVAVVLRDLILYFSSFYVIKHKKK